MDFKNPTSPSKVSVAVFVVTPSDEVITNRLVLFNQPSPMLDRTLTELQQGAPFMATVSEIGKPP